MDTKFLRTKQKNESIQMSNLDFSHHWLNTMNLGEMHCSYVEPIFPRDSVEQRANDEVILQPLENPSFSKLKLCHKTFYMPNTFLWKYWDQFITNKPDFTWTNSNIQSFIDENSPWTPPFFYYFQALPILCFAKGMFDFIKIIPWSPKGQILDLHGINNIPDLLNCTTNDWQTMINIFNHGNFTKKEVRASSNYVDCSYHYDDDYDFEDWTKIQGSVLASNSYLDMMCNQSDMYKYVVDSSTKVPLNDSTLSASIKNTYQFAVVFRMSRDQYFDMSIEGEDFKTLNLHKFEGKTAFKARGTATATLQTLNALQFFEGKDHIWGILPLPYYPESNQYNMSALAYLTYLCKNSVKLLDDMGFPVNAGIPYYYERLTTPFDAMRYFAYSRSYHEFFADKQFQVNAPDWSEANGPIFPINRGTSHSGHPSDVPKDHYVDGWILHHPQIPYNVQGMNADEKLVVHTPYAVQCLFLGIQLNYSLFVSQNVDELNPLYLRTNKNLSTYYMTYNGLLHLQYANFPPDYFTEVLLDPLAGAKDIQIPTTITQLQEKSKLQDLLNQTAWTRNIKEWLQSQFDSFSKYTQINEPSLCGSCDIDININQVLQTSESTEGNPLGTRAGIGSGYGNGNLCQREFGEHGYLFTISYIVMDTYYINRLDKKCVAINNYLEYPLPQLANLGNEAVKTYELKFDSEAYPSLSISLVGAFSLNGVKSTSVPIAFKTGVNNASQFEIMQSNGSVEQSNAAFTEIAHGTSNIQDDSDKFPMSDIFGYIPRYSAYKFHMDEVHGEFLTTLKRWVPTRELNYSVAPSYLFISYELQSQTSNLLKNFVKTDPFGSDNFLVNQVNILSIRRALPYIVKPQLD